MIVYIHVLSQTNSLPQHISLCTYFVELSRSLVATEFGSQREPEFLQFKIDQMTKIISKIHG